ncbi:hypothetical protein Dimus_013014, partial [Dionaea muscipula]
VSSLHTERKEGLSMGIDQAQQQPVKAELPHEEGRHTEHKVRGRASLFLLRSNSSSSRKSVEGTWSPYLCQSMEPSTPSSASQGASTVAELEQAMKVEHSPAMHGSQAHDGYAWESSS